MTVAARRIAVTMLVALAIVATACGSTKTKHEKLIDASFAALATDNPQILASNFAPDAVLTWKSDDLHGEFTGLTAIAANEHAAYIRYERVGSVVGHGDLYSVPFTTRLRSGGTTIASSPLPRPRTSDYGIAVFQFTGDEIVHLWILGI